MAGVQVASTMVRWVALGVVAAVPAASQRPVMVPTADGGALSVADWGSGRVAVVLAPGGRYTKESWDEQARPRSA